MRFGILACCAAIVATLADPGMAQVVSRLPPAPLRETTVEAAPASGPAAHTAVCGAEDCLPSADEPISDPNSCLSACPNCGCGSEECADHCGCHAHAPQIVLRDPRWRLTLGGALELNMLFNSARPVATGVPFFLPPGSPGIPQHSFTAHGRQTTLYAMLAGPAIGEFKTGGVIVANFFSDPVLADKYGFLPYQAYGEVKSPNWRIAAGLQSDIFAPLSPTVLPFSYLISSGNAGIFRGQLRAERYFLRDDDAEFKITTGISDPNPTEVNSDALAKDNGWPNIETSIAWSAGPAQTIGWELQHTFDLSVSSVFGQLRTTAGPTSVVANMWGLAGDLHFLITPRAGFSCEVFTGQGLGSYGGGVFQSVNTATFQPVRATGGWAEVYAYMTDTLHSHIGYGIDDPLNRDLSTAQIALNQTIYANLIWDLAKTVRVAGEFTVRKTNYVAFNDSNGVGFQTQLQWKF